MPGATTATSAPATRAVVRTPAVDSAAVFSPDGRWLAYHSSQTGRSEVFAMPLPEGAAVRVSTEGGFAPAWAPSGREIYYRAPGGRMMAAPAPASGHAGGTARDVRCVGLRTARSPSPPTGSGC